MKSLRARVKACFGMCSVTAITLTLLMSKALGQAVPDPQPVPASEPNVLLLVSAGAIVLFIMRRRK